MKRSMRYCSLLLPLLLLTAGASGPALQTGAYESQGGDILETAGLYLDEEQGFTLHEIMFSSYLYLGTYTVESGRLLLTADDGQTFVFTPGDGSLTYESALSDNGAAIADQTVFVPQDTIL